MGPAELPTGVFLVAHDAVGGFFALNGRPTHLPRGSVFYFAPDTLRWEDLGMDYENFVHWALCGDLASFYANVRFASWEREIATLTGDSGFSIYPPLWANGGRIAERSRRSVSITELWAVNQEYARQLAGLPDGAEARIVVNRDPW